MIEIIRGRFAFSFLEFYSAYTSSNNDFNACLATKLQLLRFNDYEKITPVIDACNEYAWFLVLSFFDFFFAYFFVLGSAIVVFAQRDRTCGRAAGPP